MRGRDRRREGNDGRRACGGGGFSRWPGVPSRDRQTKTRWTGGAARVGGDTKSETGSCAAAAARESPCAAAAAAAVVVLYGRASFFRHVATFPCRGSATSSRSPVKIRSVAERGRNVNTRLWHTLLSGKHTAVLLRTHNYVSRVIACRRLFRSSDY